MYDKFGILDPAGRSRSWRGWLFAEVHFVATSAAPVTTDAGMELRPTTQLTICGTPTSLWFPVLDDSDPMLADQALIAWLRNVADTAHWMASVCAGAGLLAAAGLLQRRRATTHWAYRNQLAAMDAEFVHERFIFDGRRCRGTGCGRRDLVVEGAYRLLDRAWRSPMWTSRCRRSRCIAGAGWCRGR